MEQQMVSKDLQVNNIDTVVDALKELTKQISALVSEQKKLAEEIRMKVKAGRF